MTNPVDHEAVQAAQALCMLAVDTRQQDVDDDETEDEDCIIMHARPVVRPVVQRHHPYRRPEPQRVGVPVPRSRGMSPNAEAERMEIVREYLHRDKWNVFPLEQHEMQPGAPVPEVRRVVRNGAAVPEKVPLPHMQPSGVPRSTPVQHPAPARRPLPDSKPSPVEQLTPQAASSRHPLPDRWPSPVQQPSLDLPPSPSQPSSPIEDEASPEKQYSFRALAFQALLAAHRGQWLSKSDIADYIEDRYPQFREREASLRLRRNLSSSLGHAAHLLEKSVLLDTDTLQWRLPACARKTAAKVAWKTKQPIPVPQPSSLSMSYTPKSLMLQALLAAPEGRWMLLAELVDYLLTQYPQLPGLDRSGFSSQINGALNRALDLVEKVKLPTGRHGVHWRLLPRVREEATRLAWPDRSVQSATPRVPE